MAKFRTTLDRSRREMGHSAEAAIRAFADIVTPEALGLYFDLDGERRPATRASLEQVMQDWFAGPYSKWPNAAIRFGGHDFEAPRFGLVYWGKMLGDPVYPDNRGFLDTWMPSAFYLEHSAALERHFIAAAVAYGGCAAWWDVALTGGGQRAKQAFGARYAALDISRTKSAAMDMGAAVPRVHWATYLRSDRLARLGGRSGLEGALAEGVQVIWLADGGALVRLADWPQLGDRNRRETLLRHRWLARLLDGGGLLHVPRAGRYFLDADEAPDPGAQEAWHLRFLSMA